MWKISRIHWFETFSAPYKGGWAKVRESEVSGADFLEDFPPDEPSSFDYKPWPGVYVAPFHYPNPVTGD